MRVSCNGAGQIAAGERQRAGGNALGLVSKKTKHKSEARIEISTDAARIRRMQRSVGHGARMLHFGAHGALQPQRWNIKLLTLTYRADESWQRQHIRGFVNYLREFAKRRRYRFRCVWVAELQKRGAVHYHLLVWVPRGVYLPAPDKSGWWKHGSSNVSGAKRKGGATSGAAYLVKYASKSGIDDANRLPKGARMYGVCGLTSEDARAMRYWNAPEWARKACTGRADIRRVRGGVVDAFTGEFFPTPWVVLIEPNGAIFIQRKEGF